MQLPEAYQVDGVALSDNYLNLQRRFHPDRFAGKSAQEQRLAVQMASVVNQAYDTLRSPLLRAAYLLELRGLDSSGENTTISDVAFLMSQMQLREQLAAVTGVADPFSALELIASEVAGQLESLYGQFAEHYGQNTYEAAAEVVTKMQFYHKLQIEVLDLEDALEDG
ncbi:Fe-S protein assembly co-chaperone HscB [Gammaproteobacteria bacterium 53_120_T64]|nr:Fe-S protein assembly co-chaperone HscB [Gammaproteobacteria bacterium 53_120_T64]